MSHCCFVGMPGLFKSSFIDDNNNMNVFTKNFNFSNEQVASNSCIWVDPLFSPQKEITAS